MPRAIRSEILTRGQALAIGIGMAAVVGLVAMPVAPNRAPAIVADAVRAERAFHATDRDDGAVVLTDAATGGVVLVVAPGEDGFVRGTLRGLARERRARDLGPQVPFRLIAWGDGRLTLDDTATGRRLDLLAFGQTQAEAFARLLPIGEKRE
ncbi:photosynthetic complex assembly protein PuhC [Neoroseomonas rubea]|uniref:photosynthetic complex assembly protein PuhC n=1 Tax=Neoroseomonas rubea TaxID=2748666 RepID=UPI0018DF169D|nr:photosynthetic complex assembly protein PuhC [Roseomonas rubea]